MCYHARMNKKLQILTMLAMITLAGCSTAPENKLSSPSALTSAPTTPQTPKYSLKFISVTTNQGAVVQNSQSNTEAPIQTAAISPKAGNVKAQRQAMFFANMQMPNVDIINALQEKQLDDTKTPTEENVITNNYYSKAQKLEMQIIFGQQEVIESIDEA